MEIMKGCADMRPFYARARLMLVPPLWFESFGMVCVEGFMNKVPTLASTNGNLRNTVGSRRDLFRCPQAHSGGLATLARHRGNGALVFGFA